MGLQVRVKHALGSRLIDLPDRTIDNPVVVGRAAGVDVQVPSVSVAARHCVLFRYEGHWAVQDVQAASGAGTSGTFVNGEQVLDPVPLQIGDIISVGSESAAPTIEVDPAAAAEGRTGWAGDEVAAAPMAPGYAAPAGYAAPPGYGSAPGYVSTTAGYNRAAPRRTPPAPAAWHGDAGHDNGDHIDMSAATTTPSYSRSYRKKKPQLSPAPVMIGAAISIAIIGLAAWWIVSHQQQPPVAVVTPKPHVEGDSGHANNIFGVGGSSTPDRSNDVAPRPVTPQPAAAPDDTQNSGSPPAPKPVIPDKSPSSPAREGTGQVASVGTPPVSEEMTPSKPGKPAPAAPPTPAGPKDEWDEMQDLYNTPTDPALAIFRFNDFQKHHPGEHADDLQKYIDTKFDRLWWDRIEQLFKKTDRLIKDAKDKQDAIFDETDKDMKKKEQDELTKLKAEQKQTKEIVTAKMGYAEDQPPPSGATELAALREKRDKAKYSEWKRITLNSIVSNKGKTDWEADN